MTKATGDLAVVPGNDLNTDHDGNDTVAEYLDG